MSVTTAQLAIEVEKQWQAVFGPRGSAPGIGRDEWEQVVFRALKRYVVDAVRRGFGGVRAGNEELLWHVYTFDPDARAAHARADTVRVMRSHWKDSVKRRGRMFSSKEGGLRFSIEVIDTGDVVIRVENETGPIAPEEARLPGIETLVPRVVPAEAQERGRALLTEWCARGRKEPGYIHALSTLSMDELLAHTAGVSAARQAGAPFDISDLLARTSQVASDEVTDVDGAEVSKTFGGWVRKQWRKLSPEKRSEAQALLKEAKQEGPTSWRWGALVSLLLAAGCALAIHYFLQTEGKGLTAGGVTIRRDQTSALQYGYWFMWDSNGDALSAFHVLRNGEDITTKVRLFERHFRDGTSYGAEDLSVNPNATYRYAIARGPKIFRRVSLPFRACRDCLVEKLAAARLAIAHGLPVEESSPESATTKAQVSFGGISIAYAGQPASFHGALLPDKFLGRQVDPSSLAADESAWVEVDFGDGPPEIWPQGTVIHTWARAGQYLCRYRLMDERAAKHSTVQVSIHTVQKRRLNQDPSFEFYFMPRDRSSLPAAFANEILRPRLVRAPVGAIVRQHIDLAQLSMWPGRVRGATLISDYGDGKRRQETIQSANRVDAIIRDHDL